MTYGVVGFLKRAEHEDYYDVGTPISRRSRWRRERRRRRMEASRCAESSATRGRTRRARSWWRGCAGWSIAATTARGWRRSTTGRLVVRKRAGRVRVLEELLDREPGAGPLRDQPHAMGDPRPGHRPQRPSAPRRARRCGGRRRRPQRRDREPRGAPPRARGARASPSRARPTPRSIAHLIARELERRRRPVRGRPAGLAAAGGDVRPGGRQPEAARRGRRGAARQPAGRRAWARASTSWPATRSAIAPHTARVAYLQDGEVVRLTPDDFEIRHRERGLDHAEDRPDRLEARRGRAGRPRPLHAQGDPRAARHGARRLPRPAPPRRGDRAVRRPEPHGPRSSAGSAGSSSPPAARAGTRPWSAST